MTQQLYFSITVEKAAEYQSVKNNFTEFSEFYLKCIRDQRSHVRLKKTYLALHMVQDTAGKYTILPPEVSLFRNLNDNDNQKVTTVFQLIQEASKIEEVEPVAVPVVEPVATSFLNRWGFSILSGVSVCAMVGLTIYCGNQVYTWA